VEQLSTRLTIPIHLQDERLTTAEARRVVAVSKGGAGKDAIAASLLLQAYLDSHRPV
jgi:RNase H-fold protein (predicted Holliday junction resolvase)